MSHLRRPCLGVPVLLVLAALSTAGPGASPAAAQSNCTYQHTYPYLGDRPKEADLGWNEEAQGISHDDANWYITQKNRLWKIPGTRDLGADVSCSEVSCRDLGDTQLGQDGFDHLGDLTHFQGFLCIGVEFHDKAEDAVLAIFRASDLSLVDSAPLPDLEGTSAWCAVDAGGFAYSSKETVTELSRYEVNWGAFDQGLEVTKVGTVQLLDELGDTLELPLMQGGVFSDDGLLYLINGNGTSDCAGCGIHVFKVTLTGSGAPCSEGPGDCIARRLDRSRNGQDPFNYQYNPGSVFNREEPEGITYWDLTAPGAPAAPGTTTRDQPVASSQLHALMLDNDITNDDDIYVKHYGVRVECEPAPDIRVAPTAVDFGEVDLGATASRTVTVSNEGNAPLGISTVAIDPGTSSPFTLGSAPPLPSEVAAGDQVEVDVQFTPADGTVASAHLTIDSDDPDDSRVSVDLGGVGLSLPAQAEMLLEQFDEAIQTGELQGTGPGGAGERRWEALRNMLAEAQQLVEAERFAEACAQLDDALARTDGAPRPPDFVTGDAAPLLAVEIQDLRSHLPCETG